MKERLPILTLLLVIGCCGVHQWPAAREFLIQNRDSVHSGEWWRLFTGNLVHHSASHLCWNCLVVAFAGTVVERTSRRGWLACTAAAACLIGPVLHFLCPAMIAYAGMSGIATALVACHLTGCLRFPGAHRWIGTSGLVLLTAKLGWESMTTSSLFTSFNSVTVVNIPEAHWVGLAVGIFAYLAVKRTHQGPFCQRERTNSVNYFMEAESSSFQAGGFDPSGPVTALNNMTR